MDLFLVFNELSIHPPAGITTETPDDARRWMSGFVDTVKAARKHRVNSLRTHRQFADIQLLPDYSLRQWLNDSEVDLEVQRFMRTIASKLPYLEDLPDVEDRSRLFDIKFNDQLAHGCGAAYLLESIAISFNSDQLWNSNQLELGIEELDEETVEIVTSFASIPHASSVEHIGSHSNWIEERLQSSIQDGADLLKKCKYWLPNITFTESAEQQLAEMTSGTPQLRQVLIKLFAFDDYCAQWSEGGFTPEKLPYNITLESQTVRTNPQLRSMREFTCKDGKVRFFEWHARLTPDAWRLHFYPDTDNRKIIVGYVGRKLPTARY